jgi:hypothetical protein
MPLAMADHGDEFAIFEPDPHRAGAGRRIVEDVEHVKGALPGSLRGNTRGESPAVRTGGRRTGAHGPGVS